MAKSAPIFQFSNKDTSFFFKVEERKFKGEIRIRGKEDPEVTIVFHEDIIVFLQEAIRRVEKATEVFSIAALHSEYKDGGYKASASIGITKNSNNGYSMTVQIVDKGSYDFPIQTVAGMSFNGVPLKEDERGRLALDKLKQKLAEAYSKLIDGSTINTGFTGFNKGNNFSQRDPNNKGNQGYKNFTAGEKSY